MYDWGIQMILNQNKKQVYSVIMECKQTYIYDNSFKIAT